MWKCSFLAALSLGFLACGPGEVVEEQALGRVQQPVLIQTVGPLKVARTSHCSVRLGDGKVLFTGGYINNNGGITATTEVYDPATRTTSLRAPMNVARRSHTCLLLRDGSVFVLSGDTPEGYYTRTTEKYNPSSNTWTLLQNMPEALGATAATQLDDGRVLAVGGSSSNRNAYLFDPVSNVWTRTGSLNVGRSSLAPIKLPDGRVLAIGGYGSPDYTRTLEVYTPSTGTWSLLSPLPISSTNPAAVLLPDGRVFLGEMDDTGANLYPQMYDSKTDTWTVLPQANSLHNINTRVGLVDGQPVVVVGGSLDFTKTPIERFDVALQRWSTHGQLSVTRDRFTMDVLTDGSVLVAGGSPINSNQPYDTMDLITFDDGTGPLSFGVSNTNSAQQNTINRTFTLKAGETVEVGTCKVPGSSASGDTYLRLFGGGTQVAYNDDSCGGLASYIQYTAPTTGIYELRVGCYASNSCGGTFAFRITPAK